MNRNIFLLLAAASVAASSSSSLAAEPAANFEMDRSTPTLRSVYKDDFLIGVALNTAQVTGRNAKAGELAGTQFSCLTAENDMKWQSLHPDPERYQFSSADAYFEF